MLKRILIAALMWPLLALAQSYPSPTFNNLTVNGTFTATGKVGLASLASQAANTVVANVTASSASPAAFAMPSCSTSSSALTYTTSTGFTCNTAVNAAQLNGATFASPPAAGYGSATPEPVAATTITATTPIAVPSGGTGRSTLTTHGVLIGEGTSAINQLAVGTTGQVLVGSTGGDPSFGTSVSGLTFTSAITPQSTGGIIGTTAADNANAGSVGEFVSSIVLVGSAVPLTTATSANVTSISLTAGDWDVWGSVSFNPGGTTVTSFVYGWVSTVSATSPTPPQSGFSTTNASGAAFSLSIPPQRINVSTTTTVYLSCQSGFSTSTQAAYGFIFARRRR